MSTIVLPFTDISKLTLWLWNLSQRQRQVDGVARRLQYGQDAPKVVRHADDDLLRPAGEPYRMFIPPSSLPLRSS